MTLAGYARIYTAEGRQVLHRQFDTWNAAGCDLTFENRASSAAPRWHNLADCLDCLWSGDVLVVKDLDRLVGLPANPSLSSTGSMSAASVSAR